MAPAGTPELLTFADADARLAGALSRRFQRTYDTVLFFDGDLVLDDDFPTDTGYLHEGADADLVAVAGDLTVEGRIALYDGDDPALYVAGTTTAETLEAGDPEIHLHDGVFTFLVYGEDDRGVLRTGAVRTPWVINADHDLRVTAPDAHRVDYADGDDLERTFVDEVIDEGEIDITTFVGRLRAGLPVARTRATARRS